MLNIKNLSIALVLFTFIRDVNADDLLLKADIGYGEYLSSGCLTCHQLQGESNGIPSIVGLDAEYLATLLQAFKSKELENQAMQMVAGQLDDEQIASLSVYFASLPAQQ